MSELNRLTCKTFRKPIAKSISVCVISTLSVAAFSTVAIAQQVTQTTLPTDSDMFSQQVTDAITQGFRQTEDQFFFEDGLQQFEEEIRNLQNGESPEAILTIESVFDDWQSLEESIETMP